MRQCAVIIQPKLTMSEAERSHRLATMAAIYRIILEALRRATEEQGEDGANR